MVEKNESISTIATNFVDLKDPRVVGRSNHKLLDILVIGICTVVCGGDDYPSMRSFGKAKEEWLGTFLELPNGIPSSDTFWRVFGALDPDQFQECFLNWMATISTVTEGEIVDAIRRGARTVQGIQFATRAGMGRCQRNWCGSKLINILAKELGMSETDVTFKGHGSEILR